MLLVTSGYGVRGVNKDPQGGRGDSTPALYAYRGGDPVFDWPSPDPLVQARQHGGTVAAALQHRLHREKVIISLSIPCDPPEQLCFHS